MQARVFGYTAVSLLSLYIGVERSLDVLEVFSGVGVVAQAAHERGHQAAAFDINRIPGQTDTPYGSCSEDLAGKDGFMHCVELVASLRIGGLLWWGYRITSGLLQSE